MKKGRNIIIYIVIVLGIIIAVNTIRHFSPVTLDADYLTELEMGSTSYDNLFYTYELEHGNGVFCFATISGDSEHIAMVYLEKAKHGYDKKNTVTFNIDTLYSDDTQFSEIISVNSSYKDESIYYSIFSDPQRESVVVNGNEVNVEVISFKLGGETRTIGFWSVVLPNDDTINVLDGEYDEIVFERKNTY